MNRPWSLVTGAGGFVGSRVVDALRLRHVGVRAGIHECGRFGSPPRGVETVHLELGDPKSLERALCGVDTVYHFAAVLHTNGGSQQMRATNVDGTRNLCEAAVRAGVARFLYCSSAAVYGLLSAGAGPISEAAAPRPFEAYGRSKLEGERLALALTHHGMRVIVIRPAAVLGPGEHTPIGRRLRRAAVSRILVPGPFAETGFSFVHVEDVAEAAVHLMDTDHDTERIFNIAVPRPITFAAAFRAYRRALARSERPMRRARLLAWLSSLAQRSPFVCRIASAATRRRLLFTVWQPGFDLVYSAERLMATSYRFRRLSFEEVVLSCVDD